MNSIIDQQRDNNAFGIEPMLKLIPTGVGLFEQLLKDKNIERIRQIEYIRAVCFYKENLPRI